MLLLAEVRLLYLREMRAALREKNIVINSILIPILLYPFMMWAVVTGFTLVQGQTEGFVSRLVVTAEGETAQAVVRELRRQPRLAILASAPTDPLEALRGGEVDAVLELHPGRGLAAAVPGSLSATLHVNGSRERSRAAQERLRQLLQRWETRVLEERARELGVEERRWHRFTLLQRNLASGREMGAFLLGLMLPLFFVIMVAVGCFYPAVDATAGERERGTWETTLSLGTSRLSVMVAKYLVVTTFGFLAGGLNLAAMAVSLGAIVKPLLGPEDADLALTLSPGAVPVAAAAALLLAAFVAAGMLLLASFARTFKEGQAMITPFYMLTLLPAVFLSVPGLELTYPLALVPVVNVALLLRGAIGGTLGWGPALVATLASLATVWGAIRLATMVLRFEDVVLGSYGGSLGRLVRQRLLVRRSA